MICISFTTLDRGLSLDNSLDISLDIVIDLNISINLRIFNKIILLAFMFILLLFDNN